MHHIVANRVLVGKGKAETGEEKLYKMSLVEIRKAEIGEEKSYGTIHHSVYS